MMKVQITCPKDPLIEKYCRDTFEEKFNRVLSWDRGRNDPQDELKMFRNALVKEARRQEWYDFEVDDQGHRHPLYEDTGYTYAPKLLVPEVNLLQD